MLRPGGILVKIVTQTTGFVLTPRKNGPGVSSSVSWHIKPMKRIL